MEKAYQVNKMKRICLACAYIFISFFLCIITIKSNCHLKVFSFDAPVYGNDSLEDSNTLLHSKDWQGALQLYRSYSLQEKLKNLHILKEILRLLLIDAMDEPSQRLRAIQSLGYCKKEALPILKEYLHDRDPDVRIESLRALRGAFNPQITADAIKLLSDSEPEVRTKAALFLGDTSKKTCIPFLKKLLNDPERMVCLAAAKSLVVLGERQYLSLLRRALASDHWPTMSLAADFLGKLGDHKSLFLFKKGLYHKKWLVRLKCAEALGRFHSPVASAWLSQKLPLEQDPFIKLQICESLINLNNSDSILSLLYTISRSTDWTLRLEANRLLLKAEIKEGLVAIKTALRNRDAHVREYAVHALSDGTLEDCMPLLLPMLFDRKWSVRVEAARVLLKLIEIR